MFFENLPKLAIVVPCYNEMEGIESTIKKLLEYLKSLIENKIVSDKSFLYFVDDGSIDDTFGVISKYNNENKMVKGTKFTRNFGNQNAILAGMLSAKDLGADCVITIDADLQQDINVIKDFVQKYKEGFEIVLGVRTTYEKTGFIKKLTSSLFYKTMKLLGAQTTPNHSEYRLVGKKALNILSQYTEYSLFLRGVISEIGLKQTTVPYTTVEREFGKTKFNLANLTGLALDGITSASIVPLRFVAVLGIILALFSFGFGIEVMIEKYFLKNTIPGWATIVVSVCFFSGVQIFCLGIIGEYLGQIYRQVKGRPRYVKDIELS